MSDELPTLEQVVAKVKANMAETYDLVYVAYDDQFNDEQIEVLLSGENPWEHRAFDLLQESESEERWTQSTEEIKNLLDDEEWEVLEDADELDELRQEVQDRDRSNWFNELLGHSGRVLMRLSLDVDVPSIGYDSEPDIEQHLTDILDELAGDERLTPETVTLLPQLRPQLRTIVNEQAYYGGSLEIFFNGDVSDWYEQLWNVRNGKKVTVTFTDFYLLARDGLNGSGYDEKIVGLPFSLTLRDGDVVTDANGGGYGWDSIAGLVHSAYDTDVTFTVEENEASTVAAE